MIRDYLASRAATQAYARILEFLLLTGCRPGEAISATVGTIRSGENPCLVLVEHKTAKATGEPRIVPLASQAFEIVQESLEVWGRRDEDMRIFPRPDRNGSPVPMTANGLLQALKKACRRIGCPPYSPAQLRHNAATLALEATGMENHVKAMLGHTHESTTVRRYSRDRFEIAKTAAEALDRAYSRLSPNGEDD